MGDAPDLGEAPSERELELFRAYEAHGSIDKVAEAMGLSPKYVRNKLSFLYKKLGVSTGVQAGGKLRERGVLTNG